MGPSSLPMKHEAGNLSSISGGCWTFILFIVLKFFSNSPCCQRKLALGRVEGLGIQRLYASFPHGFFQEVSGVITTRAPSQRFLCLKHGLAYPNPPSSYLGRLFIFVI
jgi:hypothetical protein